MCALQIYLREHDGVVVKCRTPNREVLGLIVDWDLKPQYKHVSTRLKNC